MHEESKSIILTQRLWREVIHRGRYSAVTHLLVGIASLFIARKLHLDLPITLSSYGIILIGNIYRIIICRKIGRDGIPSRNTEAFYYACTGIIGLGWGLYWYDVNAYYGQTSIQSIFALLTLSAFLSGAVTPHAPKPLGYVFFSLFMLSIPIYVFFNQLQVEVTTLGISMTFYLAYSLAQLRVSYMTIRDYFDSELQIQFERNKIQTLINAVPGYVFFIDKNLNFIMVNEYARLVFHLNEITGRSMNHMKPGDEFLDFVNNFITGTKSMSTAEIEINTQLGRRTSILSIQKIHDPTGGAVIVGIPMDELIEAREKMKIQEAKSFNNAKLISLGEMAAGIAHEINNPLAIILGSSDQIMRSLSRPELDHERLVMLTEKIQRTVDRISGIIKNLRVLSRNGDKDPHMKLRVDLILGPSIEISRQRFLEEKVALDIIKPDQEVNCIGQEIPLSQVVMNVLNNAFDAASVGPEPRWVKLSVKPIGDFVDVLIQDSGDGISHDIRYKIMDPFFTTKPMDKGTGLGLSISKSIMEQHGGSLILDESAENTTFIIRLKAAPA